MGKKDAREAQERDKPMAKMIVNERKVLKKEDWLRLLKIVFQLTGMKEPTADKIVFAVNDDGAWNLDVGGLLSIYHDEEVIEVNSIRGKKQKQLFKGYRWMTFHTTYSYNDGYDVEEKQRGFSNSPQGVISDIINSFHAERVNDALEQFDCDLMDREQEEFDKVLDEHYQRAVDDDTNSDAYDELAVDYRDRLESHNRQVLSQL